MRAHYLQHVPFEGLGSIEVWLQNAGFEITNTQLYRSEELPEVEDIDLLVVMGGPMSVNDENQYPWLADEKSFIISAIEAGIPTLGICLGAQLIAKALGADVLANPVKEIGWFPVQATQPQSAELFSLSSEVDVFHWHGETFSLPPGAVRIAESRGCKNQAFQIGTNVIGLQFHLETTADSAQAIVENCRDELVKAQYVQTEDEILSAPQEKYDCINSLMGELLEYLTAK